MNLQNNPNSLETRQLNEIASKLKATNLLLTDIKNVYSGYRTYISSEVISVTTAPSTLTPPINANYAEVYIGSTACIWGFVDSSLYPIPGSANTMIPVKSASELQAFEIRTASGSTSITINYFKI